MTNKQKRKALRAHKAQKTQKGQWKTAALCRGRAVSTKVLSLRRQKHASSIDKNGKNIFLWFFFYSFFTCPFPRHPKKYFSHFSTKFIIIINELLSTLFELCTHKRIFFFLFLAYFSLPAAYYYINVFPLSVFSFPHFTLANRIM